MKTSKLKILRLSNGYTQFDVARELGCSEKLISAWETGRGKPNTTQCFKLSKLLGSAVEEIFPERFNNNSLEIQKTPDKVTPDYKKINANARLIAAAPLMFDVLKHTLARLEAKNITGAWVDEIKEAIAKAEGA